MKRFAAWLIIHHRETDSIPGSYDYIIVGAGSAGCVIANRLTENPDIQVLLLEAGPRDNNLKLKIPRAFIYNYTRAQHNWMYQTEPQPQMDGRRIFCPRGKVLGGSSSINGMAFVPVSGWSPMDVVLPSAREGLSKGTWNRSGSFHWMTFTSRLSGYSMPR